jgi:glycosyltransferase involved in cell wall biosynthesis
LIESRDIKHRCLVVLPTYNGEKFLSQQIESILNQEDVVIRLFVLDDSSTDKTNEILENYNNCNVHCYRSRENRGTLNSLLDLVKHVEPDEYLAFADQDDVWSPGHLISAVQTLQKLDNEKFNLYFPHYAFIDRNGNMLVRRKTRKIVGIQNALIENPAIGCGIVVNPFAATFVKNFSFIKDLHMDNQLYFIACLLGSVSQGEEQTVYYRLHDKNQIGIRTNLELGNVQKRISQLRNRQHALEQIYLALRPEIDSKKRHLVDDHFESLKKGGFRLAHYSLFPNFKRESFRDQVIIQILSGLGMIY